MNLRVSEGLQIYTCIIYKFYSLSLSLSLSLLYQLAKQCGVCTIPADHPDSPEYSGIQHHEEQLQEQAAVNLEEGSPNR